MRLLGIVNPAKDPAKDPLEYWLWEAGGVIPEGSNWDYERLNVYSYPAPDGNVCVYVMGEASPKYLDGCYLKMHINPDLNPRPRVSSGAPAESLNASLEAAKRTTLVPILDSTAGQTGMRGDGQASLDQGRV